MIRADRLISEHLMRTGMDQALTTPGALRGFLYQEIDLVRLKTGDSLLVRNAFGNSTRCRSHNEVSGSA